MIEKTFIDHDEGVDKTYLRAIGLKVMLRNMAVSSKPDSLMRPPLDLQYNIHEGMKNELEALILANRPCGEIRATMILMMHFEDFVGLDYFASKIAVFPEYAVTLAVIDVVRDRGLMRFPKIGGFLNRCKGHAVQWPESYDKGYFKTW